MFEKLLAFIFPPRKDEKMLHALSKDEFLGYLSPTEFYLDELTVLTLLSFRNATVRAAVHEAKYHGTTRAQEFLAAALSEYLKDADDYRARQIVLVPIPLGRLRQQARGFNQVEEVAKKTAKELGLMLETGLLERVRETVSQVTLPREARRKNMSGAFRAIKEANPAYLYIVMDDVVTTGATLEAAVAAVRASGALHIEALALTH